MPRSRERKCCYSRWSEPLLNRRYSKYFTLPISDGESSSVRKSGSSSTFLRDIKLQPTYSLEPETSGCCCGCGSHCRRKRSFKSRASSRAADNFSKKSSCDRTEAFYKRKQESLVIELVGNEIEESIAGEKLNGLIKNFEISNDSLEVLLIHVKSLKNSQSSAQRVFRLANELLFEQRRYSSSSSFLTVDIEARLSQAESSIEEKLRTLIEVGESSSKNLNLSKELNSLIDEHRVKRKDFNLAVKNFQKLLRDTKLSSYQMEKLQRQYQMIIHDYRDNRRVLEIELPKIIKTRLAAIRYAFKTIAEYYDDTENSKKFSNLLKIYSDIIFREDGAMDKRRYEKSYDVKSDICQKCKVNRVPVVSAAAAVVVDKK